MQFTTSFPFIFSFSFPKILGYRYFFLSLALQGGFWAVSEHFPKPPKSPKKNRRDFGGGKFTPRACTLPHQDLGQIRN